MFKPVSPKIDFPKLEQEILDYWKKNKIFEKSVEIRPKNKRWTFLDGPPFVTGVPHYGSLLSSIPKDVFARFMTMKGYRVRRVWGWDGHGLPIENKVEEKLGVKRKKDIEEKIGVGKFIEECKKYVNEVSADWEWYIEHIGRWVDFKNAYKTWSLNYMESVMWVFKQMYDKGFIYKGLKVTLYCPHCATPISNFEVAMDSDNYKEVEDHATVYKYELKLKTQSFDLPQDKKAILRFHSGQELRTYILAWSTTPWNKIVTSALAVNPNLEYVKLEQNNEYYILAKSRLKILKNEPYKIIKKFKGKDLIGKKFQPHYDYYSKEKGEKIWEIIGGDFVLEDEGTGVVTIAPYGQEDLAIMQDEKVHVEIHLDEEGTVLPNVPKFAGMFYLLANRAVIEDLTFRDLIYSDKEEAHNVPLCWRCHTKLYYAPIVAWYVNVQTLKPLLKKTNEEINWFPKHFKYGRFLKSLENAPDWNISRNRYWGSPVPVWECKCGERFVPGSIKELENESGQKITDLHKPLIDEITVTCKKCGKKVHRVTEVLDSWIEAGSASFAERHFPFEGGEKLEDFFPPDFIAEYTGQIRAWFYVLHVIGGALFESKSFKNVVVEGVILGTDGRKMSKNYGNYPDPGEMLKKYGGDALRLYLMGSPVMNGEDIIISGGQYKNQIKEIMLIFWNIYNFFVTYANIDKFKVQSRHGGTKFKVSENVLDRWIASLINRLVEDVTKDLENFDTVSAIEKINMFVDDLSKWYIRRSRDRVGASAENAEDKKAFYRTCYEILVILSKVLAPFTPFLAEEIYRNLTNEESVHLSDWPESEHSLIDSKIELEMEFVRKVCEMGHAKRKELGIKVRQPLKKYQISNIKYQIDEKLIELIKDELNVKKVEFIAKKGELSIEFDTKITPELKNEGEAREIVRMIQEERKNLGTKLDERISVVLPDWPLDFEEYIKTRALVNNIKKGEKLEVQKA